jgi:hypothetical protein
MSFQFFSSIAVVVVVVVVAVVVLIHSVQKIVTPCVRWGGVLACLFLTGMLIE